MNSTEDTAARALWYLAPGQAELRDTTLGPLASDHVRVRTLASAISRGTEGLVFRGEVPESEIDRMRAPFQAGDFPFPVKYGYAAVGRVEAGPAWCVKSRVFALHPHQDLFDVPADAAVAIPETVPSERAVLAANMETALNGIWDGGLSAGDKVAIVGGGVVGLLVAYLAARTPGTEVTVLDINPARGPIATAFGAAFGHPSEADGAYDLVFHTSASGVGFDTALRLADFEATVVELSWYGTKPVLASLGGVFHSKRLTLRSSQVGAVAPSRRARWSTKRRLAKALDLLGDPALDRLLEPAIAFADSPERLGEVFSAERGMLCPLLRYPAATDI
ncbi:zinc-binding alcohol dehydrogenase [Amorphus sp. 3PC139-8]|uniref:zinc-dependent alcohol dehydrogenase n=1 Tax=Amorphus sp. 3PC139-8 TaxID=2735676 RepID=UPI00345DDA7D